jgi:NADPH:quinone reductase-like Zn-dependent oxidoreductase
MATNDDMRAVVVDEAAPGRLTVGRVPMPTPAAGEALIRVAAISLNRGEVKTAMTAATGWRPGWDFAGTVEASAADGSGPALGTRVVGAAPVGAWCEYIAAVPFMIAPLPDTVSFEAAATLPVAAGTALHALRRGPQKAGRRVLITGASGGVGVYAIQLAANTGAEVTAAIRTPSHEALVRGLGAQHVTLGETLAADIGPFDLIVDSVGGRTLGTALGLLAPGGTVVNLGGSDASLTEFDVSKFRGAGGASLYGLAMFYEMQHEPPSIVLAELAGMVAAGKLQPVIERRGAIDDIAEIAQALMSRRFTGKAVLTF